MSSHRYDIDGLVEALVSAERYRNAVPELRDWHRARASSLSEALSVKENESSPDHSADGPGAEQPAQLVRPQLT